jgi:hypothetical protein
LFRDAEMHGTLLAIATAIFIFLLLSVLLQNEVTPPLPAAQATLAAVSATATRAAEQATKTTTERTLVATTEALQIETSALQTRTAEETSPPPASSMEGAAGSP